ncbi:universal stress protein [Dactylosporangium sp. CS-047395]|uniref:universal stress protein n=1 Tax=Dactylosporangium sp. CS-047395 TaxID=3239936 RepID=UPI003D8D0398
MTRDGLVVVGFDGSATAWTALDYAATEAILRGYDVRLVHALLSPAEYGETAVIKPVEDVPTEARRLIEFAREYLYRQHGALRVQAHIADRPAGALLVSEAHAADLVVVGRRGRGLLPVRLGSVSSHVAEHASCPVTVVAATPQHPGGPVVVGIDAATPSEPALELAFDLVDRHGSTLLACYAFTPGHTSGHPDTETAGRLLDIALAGWCARYPHVTVRSLIVRNRDVTAALLDASAIASTLVVGAGHGTGPVRRALTRRAAAPLVVARPSRRLAHLGRTSA